MAGEIDSTEKIGQGFIDSKGNIKPKEVLAKEDSKAQSKESEAVKSSVNDQSLETALSRVGARFNEKASNIATSLNVQDGNLKEAKKIVKEEIQTAKDLKAALKAGDTEKVEASKQKLQDLEVKRSDLAKQIQSDNAKSRESDGVLSLGNNVKGSVETPEVEFGSSAIKSDSLDSVDKVDSLIDSLQSERTSITEQQGDVRSARKEVKGLVTEANQELASIEQDSIRTLQRAQEAANKLAQDIRGVGAQSVLAQNVNANVVRALLA